jgi:hypothetical protein
VLKSACERTYTLIDIGPVHGIISHALQIPCGMILGGDYLQKDRAVRL